MLASSSKTIPTWLLRASLLAGIGLQSAFAANAPTAPASGVMQGFPPRAEMRVTKGNAFQAPYLRWAVGHAREISPTSNIGHSDTPLPLKTGGQRDLDALEVDIDHKAMPLLRYLQESDTDGFIVLHHGAIVYERYFNGLGEHQPHIWASMTKSANGLLAAQLIAEGKLDPEARLARYVPELAASPFGQATVQQNLDMAVPVAYPEGLPPDMGLFAAIGLIPRKPGAPADIYSFLQVARAPAGTVGGPLFYYQNGSPEALAWAMRRITGQRWSELLAQRLWSRFAADDAYVQVDELGTEMASGGISCTLRDTARFAQLLLRERAREDGGDSFTQAVRSLFASNDNQASFAKGNVAQGRDGYSYRNYWYQKNDGAGSIEAGGRFGQKIYINPQRQLVVVKLSSSSDLRPRASSAGDAGPAQPMRSVHSATAFNSAIDSLLQGLPR